MADSRTKGNKILEAACWYNLVGIDYAATKIPNLQIDHFLTQEQNSANNLQYLESDQLNASNLAEEQANYTGHISNASYNIMTARKIADKVTSLDELEQELLKFDLCDLKRTARNLVFGAGSRSAKIMLIGEAPGATEDEKKIPFCGISGQLLDNMLATIGLFREKNFYITNTVFWRPPNNRPPLAEEIEICRPFLEKHIALIQPKIIVLVGSVALNTLLGNKYQISSCRRTMQRYSNPYMQNINTTAIFHPAYLIRQPLKKKTAWFDMLELKKTLITQNIL